MSSHLLLPSLSSFFFLPLSQGHIKQKNGNCCPFRPKSTCFGGRFSQNWPYQHVSVVVSAISVPVSTRISPFWLESAQIWLSRRESTHKKKKRGVSESNAASDSGVATLEPHRCFLAHYQKRYLFLKISIHVPEQSCIFPVE